VAWDEGISVKGYEKFEVYLCAAGSDDISKNHPLAGGFCFEPRGLSGFLLFLPLGLVAKLEFGTIF
jgi:hypothetical protein